MTLGLEFLKAEYPFSLSTLDIMIKYGLKICVLLAPKTEGKTP